MDSQVTWIQGCISWGNPGTAAAKVSLPLRYGAGLLPTPGTGLSLHQTLPVGSLRGSPFAVTSLGSAGHRGRGKWSQPAAGQPPSPSSSPLWTALSSVFLRKWHTFPCLWCCWQRSCLPPFTCLLRPQGEEMRRVSSSEREGNQGPGWGWSQRASGI